MKKLLTLFVCLITLLSLGACASKYDLSNHVSELRSNVYFGQSQNYTVKGGYGFKETPYQNDGVVANRVYLLTLKLVGLETTNSSYTASLEYNGEKYSSAFKLSPVTHSLTACIEIENFTANAFEVVITSGEQSQTVTMNSLVPDGTINYVTALNCLQKERGELLKAFSDSDGVFIGEIYARIIVKDGKAYWYIGLAGGNDKLKALLIDGASGEILAIREIF